MGREQITLTSLPFVQGTEPASCLDWFFDASLPILEKEMATHSSTLTWKIPWTEEPGRLQSMGSQSWTRLSDFPFTLLILGFLRVEPTGLYFRAGYDWQDHATLYSGVLRALLCSDHPVYSYKRKLVGG